MSTHRTLAAVATICLVPILGTAVVAGPAAAHGALDSPVSRAAACGADGEQAANSAACQAVVAARGTGSFTDWDNVRVAGVGGRDRELIPDGRLCSGGVAAYGGLDLPRSDWPTTSVTAGSDFTFTYRETIPHKGLFRLYVTKDGYQPTERLGWDDLEAEPFLTATDPANRNRQYVVPGKLPAGKTGRHLIYTIWQNSDTPDTYYSCSDVMFTGNSGGSQPPAAESPGVDADGVAPAERPSTGSRITQSPTPQPPAPGAPAKASSSSRLSDIGSRSYVLSLSAGIVVLLAVAGAFFLKRRRPTRGRHH